MRISSIQVYSKSVSEMLDKQANVSQMQVHIASGKKIFTPSDDPVGASKAMLLKQELNSSSIYQKNCTYAKNLLEQQENVLTSSINIVQRISELTIQAGNGALSDTDRYAIVQEIDVRKQELFDLANMKDSNGDFAFSGFKSNVSALKITNAGEVIYQGDDGQRQLKLGGSAEISSNLTGKSLFFNINNNNLIANIKSGESVVSSTNSGLVNSSSLPTLSTVDLIINRAKIPATLSDGVSTSDSSGSAIAFVNAINATQLDHKVWASALSNQVNLGIFTNGSISSNELVINQVSIVDPIGTESSLMDAINLQSDLTGVIAEQPGGAGTAIVLTAADGRNIQVKTNGASAATFANFNLSGGVVLDKVQRAGVMLRSTMPIDIGGANPADIGMFAANYPVSVNTGTASIKAEIISPISDLSENYSVIFGTGGTSFSIVNDKNPSKAVTGFENLPYIPGQMVDFQSFRLTLSGSPQAGDTLSLSSEKPAFQNIFKTIDNLMFAIKNYGKEPDRLNYEIGVGLSNLENAQNNFSKIQSIVGASLNVAESQIDIQAEFQLITREVLSQIEDLDYAQAISDLTQATFILEAAQKSFVHIQSLSIFNYLRN
jgi:flagellar hook-associated protein 3